MKTLTLIFLFLLMAVQVQATTLYKKDFGALMEESQGAVAGTVQKIESHYDQDGEIYTFVTLDNLEILHGAYDQPTLVLQLKGGEVKRKLKDGKVKRDILEVVGSPKFHQNERVIVFVRGNGTKMVPLVGWTQGMFRVANDQITGRSTIHDHEDNRVFGIKGRKLLKERRHRPEAHLMDRDIGARVPGKSKSSGSAPMAAKKPGRATVFSEMGKANPGQPDEVGPPKFDLAPQGDELAVKETMSLEVFGRAIREHATTQAKKDATTPAQQAATINNVNVHEFRMLGHAKPGRDVPAPGRKRGMRMLPAPDAAGEEGKPVLPKPFPRVGNGADQ